MLSRAVLLGILDRALKAFGQTAGALLLAGHVLNVLAVDWLPLLGTALGAMVLSVLTSLGSLPLGDSGTTSAIPGAK